jgi:hypothetical protein
MTLQTNKQNKTKQQSSEKQSIHYSEHSRTEKGITSFFDEEMDDFAFALRELDVVTIMNSLCEWATSQGTASTTRKNNTKSDIPIGIQRRTVLIRFT